MDCTCIEEPNTYPDLQASGKLEQGDLMAQEDLSLQGNLLHHPFQEDLEHQEDLSI